MALTKNCKQCNCEFKIEDEDLEFYKKISPTFAGKTFEIPAPTLCFECRLRRRLTCRNVRNVYRRKSDQSGKELVSPYAPNSPYKIYSVEEFESDDFDVRSYDRDFDFTRPFFEQLKELQLEVPRPHASIVSATMENAEFVSGASYVKNAYMSFNVIANEDIYYCDSVFHSKKCIDCLFCLKVENSYECVSCSGLYGCFYCLNCQNSRNLYFCNNLNGCQDCFGCVNLTNKQYFVFNKPFSKENYENFIENFNFDEEGILKTKEKVKDLSNTLPHKFAQIIQCDNCTGTYLKNSKNCKNTFETNNAENINNGFTLQDNVKDSQDISNVFNNAEQCFEYISGGHNANNLLFCSYCFSNCRNLYYCDSCYNSSKNLFGCIGLIGREYCILNKQYSKEEYEALVVKIIEHMQKMGEWGEFFPIGFSAFAYNESLAGEYFPLSKDEALNLGSRWQDDNFDAQYVGPFYGPKNIKQYDPMLNTKSQSEIDQALKGIVKCEISGRPFKLIAQEIAFYIEHSLPIPTKHPKVRYEERFALRDPLKLYHRQCLCEEADHGHEGRCESELETTYAPERKEKVYCEDCYQRSVI